VIAIGAHAETVAREGVVVITSPSGGAGWVEQGSRPISLCPRVHVQSHRLRLRAADMREEPISRQLTQRWIVGDSMIE
jgi:hypothetical protein